MKTSTTTTTSAGETNSKLKLSQGLAIGALVLSILYFGNGVQGPGRGFLPITPQTFILSNAVFLFGTTALSIVAFSISVRTKSVLVSALMTANGALVTIFGIISTRNLTLLFFPGPIIPFIFGVGLLAIGLTRSAITGVQLKRRTQTAATTG
jgi:hypothetical protein